MKISIAVATYNGELYLQQQLDSFLSQTRQPDEVIVSDDNSNDQTFEILSQFKRIAPFKVRILENDKNVGYKKNFERALFEVTGDLIFMSDQDDVWFDHKIETVTWYVSKYPQQHVFIHDTELTDSELNPSGRTKMHQIKRLGGDMSGMVMGTCTAIRKEFLEICLPIPDGITGHDDWLHETSKLLNLRKIIDKPLQYYRIHGANTSDHVANTPKRINIFSYVFYILMDGEKHVSRLQKRKLYNERLLSWIDRNYAEINRGIKPKLDYEEVIQKLKNKIFVLQERISFQGLSKSKIVTKALSLYFAGRYKHFSGWKSLLKDIIIST